MTGLDLQTDPAAKVYTCELVAFTQTCQTTELVFVTRQLCLRRHDRTTMERTRPRVQGAQVSASAFALHNN